MPDADPLPTDRKPTAAELLTYCRTAHTDVAEAVLEELLYHAPGPNDPPCHRLPAGGCVVVSDGYVVRTFTDEGYEGWAAGSLSPLDRALLVVRLRLWAARIED